MGQVSVTIDGKVYRMGCDDGQEAYLEGLAGQLDAYVANLRTSFGEVGDMRLMVMAAVTLMDELGELKRRVEALETAAAKVDEARAQDHAAHEKREAEFAAVVERMASRVTAIAAEVASKT
jgi:cell division protein ZapA